MRAVLLLLMVRGVPSIMHTKLPCYLATFRKNWALTQPELAALLGLKSPEHISHLEHGRHQPTATILLATEILFGVPARDLFPKLFEEIEDDLVAKLYGFRQKWEADANPANLRKRQLADDALGRAIAGALSPDAI